MVWGVHNIISPDLRDAIMKAYGEVGLAPERHNGGGCCVRAAYRYCRRSPDANGVSEIIQPDKDLENNRPLLRIGTRQS